MSRGGKVVLTILAGVLALGVAGVLWFAAVMSGGFDNLLDFDHPKETDSDVRSARERGVAQADREAVALVADLAAGTGLRHEPRLSSRGDACEEGEHNWKRDTDYDLLCTVERHVLLLGEAPRAGEQLDALAAWLTQNGYRPLYGEGVQLTRHLGARAYDQGLPRSSRYAGPGARLLGVVLLAHDSPAHRLPYVGASRGPLMLDGAPVTDGFVPAQVVAPSQYGVLVSYQLESFRD